MMRAAESDLIEWDQIGYAALAGVEWNGESVSESVAINQSDLSVFLVSLQRRSCVPEVPDVSPYPVCRIQLEFKILMHSQLEREREMSV